MMPQLILTADGSHSIVAPALEATYHSIHGAIQESRKVFIESGLQYWNTMHHHAPVNILDMGFGTGLNALLSFAHAARQPQALFFETIEQYPLTEDIFGQLNYCEQLQQPGWQSDFLRMHRCEWNRTIDFPHHFKLRKINMNLTAYQPDRLFNVIYFDAFAPEKQPELWTEAIFQKLYDCLLPGGVLTTYCSKSIVRKAMQNAGFRVEKIPGPPHKREIVRAVKLS